MRVNAKIVAAALTCFGHNVCGVDRRVTPQRPRDSVFPLLVVSGSRFPSSVILSEASPRAQSKDLGAGYTRGLQITHRI